MTLYWDIIFHLGPTDTLSLYITIAKLGILGCYFSLSLTESSIKLKKIIRNQDHLELSKSYNSTNPKQSQRSLKDLDRFGTGGIVKS